MGDRLKLVVWCTLFILTMAVGFSLPQPPPVLGTVDIRIHTTIPHGQIPIISRRYWVVPVDSLAIGHTVHTHVSVTGLVTLVNKEADGDLHIKLVGPQGFIVAECIPVLPCRVPKIGEHITVKGISRKDAEHGWWEVHPVESESP